MLSEALAGVGWCVTEFSRGLRLFGIAGRAFLADDSDPAENMVSISNFEDLSDLLRNGYSSSSDYLCEERYLLFVEFNRHRFGHRR